MTSTIILQPHQIIKLEKKFTQREIADIFEVNVKTIQRWKYPTNLPKKKRGRKEIFTQGRLELLSFYITTFKLFTQKSLSRVYSQGLKRSVSQSTVCRALKRVGISYKKISYQATEQLRKKNQVKIEDFINITLLSLLQSSANIFFLDECSFHLNSAPRRGYYWKTSRLVYQKPGNKGENQTLILLVQITNGEKIIHSKLIEGGLNSQTFHEFLSEFNPPNNGKKNVLIMDNLSAHKATKSCQKLGLSTIEELLTSKNIEIIFTPPYTPELNPIEQIFNIVRQYVESEQARERDRLNSAIEEKLTFFQKEEDTTKYLKSSIKECLMKNKQICQEPYYEQV